jgi:glycosyltransferase involved in cell wall biosynthesis
MKRGNAQVAILLATYNGERFLREQLASFAAQTHSDWSLHWRDDGSNDGTVRILRDFGTLTKPSFCRGHDSNCHLGAARSFLALLRAAEPDGAAFFAFADQDDVWLPDKLARAVAALECVPRNTPALYCARQILVNERLVQISLSPEVSRPTGFPAALIQNVATGCTILLNRAAAEIVLASTPPASVFHDWWCYLLVSAAGGEVIHDGTAVILYRQHAGNVVGAPASRTARALSGLVRGPSQYMGLIRDNVVALKKQLHLLSQDHAQTLLSIARAQEGSVWQRFSVLGLPGLRRQTAVETYWFRYAFLFF